MCKLITWLSEGVGDLRGSLRGCYGTVPSCLELRSLDEPLRPALSTLTTVAKVSVAFHVGVVLICNAAAQVRGNVSVNVSRVAIVTHDSTLSPRSLLICLFSAFSRRFAALRVQLCATEHGCEL